MPTINFSQYFPDHEILGELGKSNARVIKARHKESGEIVAIKYYLFNADDETLTRFQRESQIMTKVDHPNVVKIRDVQLMAPLPYIAMQYVEGGDVRSLLKEHGALDVPTVIRLGHQIVQALEAIHEMNIIHRDIKPDNIMYRRMSSGELHFLLTDFGISKIRGSESVTVTGQAPMTLEYASPEQFDDSEKVTFATDYYSLGVVMYECICGHVPFPLGTSGYGTFSKVVETQPPPDIKNVYGLWLPISFQELLEGMLNKNPTNRISNPILLRRYFKKADLELELKEFTEETIDNKGNLSIFNQANIHKSKIIENTEYSSQNIEEFILYSKNSIRLFSLLFSTVIGALFFSKNLETLGEKKFINQVTFFSFVYTVSCCLYGYYFGLFYINSQNDMILFYLYIFLVNIIGGFILTDKYWKVIISNSIKFKEKKWVEYVLIITSIIYFCFLFFLLQL